MVNQIINGREACSFYTNVGDVTTDEVGLYVVHHPMMESFSTMSFRPQLMVEGATSYTHNPYMSERLCRNEETQKPQVMGLHVWGAQTETGGRWDYLKEPDVSRARGGVVHGGILLTPPEFEIENYFSIGTDEGPYGAASVSYLCCAPGTAFACGTPRDNGGLQAKSVIMCQLAVAGTNDPYQVLQLDSSRIGQVLFQGELDQASGEIVVDCGTGGNEAVQIPVGTTAQRPTVLGPAAGQMRSVSNLIATADAIEFYESQNGEWAQVGGNSVVASSAPTTWEGRLWLDTTCSTGVGETFISLTDTPVNFTSAAGKVLRVNAATDAVEFSNIWIDSNAIILGTGSDSTILYDGTDTIWDLQAAGSGALMIQGTEIELRDNLTDATNKTFMISGKHFTNAEEDVALISYQSTTSIGAIFIGGANASYNAATEIQFLVGDDNTTTTGVEVMRCIAQAGGVSGVRIEDGISSGTLGSPLHVVGTITAGLPAIVIEQKDIDDSFINYAGTSAADGSRSISTDTTEDSAKAGAFRIEVNGSVKWLRFYDGES